MNKSLKVILLSSAFAIAGSAGGYAQEAAPAADAAAAAPAAPPELKFSGYVNASFTGNFDDPVDKENFGQPFQDRSNRPILNQASLVAEKAADTSKDFSVGFRAQIMYGSDARLTHFLGIADLPGGRHRNQFDIIEGDVSLHTSAIGAGGTDIKIGMYPTPLGYEVIDPRVNPFASHTYIYAFGLPLKHTGAVATTHVNSTLDIWYGLDTGTNTTFGNKGDENSALGGVLGFGLNGIMGGKVTVIGLTHFGPENSRLVYPAGRANHIMRYFNDIVITTKVSDKLTLVSDFNWVREDNDTGVKPANAYGFAQYAMYALTDTITLNARGEVYRDDQGFFVGKFPGNNDFVLVEKGLPNTSVFYGKATYGEVTLGVAWKPAGLPDPFVILVRPEIRYDGTFSGAKPYDNGTKGHQFTGAVDVTLTF